MNCFINWAKTSKIIRKINLKVQTNNVAAIKLYKKLGFKKEGLIKFVPETVYWLVEGKKIIVRVPIRHRLTRNLRRVGGHIGYEILEDQSIEIIDIDYRGNIY